MVSGSEWLDGIPRRRRRRRKKKPAEAPVDPELVEQLQDESGLPCVAWLPVRCYYCGSKRQHCYGTNGRVRYHECQDCSRRFKSVELEPERAPGQAADAAPE